MRTVLHKQAALVLITATAFLITTGCSEKIDTADEFVLVAQVHEREGRTEKAIEAYSQAIKLQPDDATTWYDRGVAHGTSNDLKKAIDDYNKAIELDPNFAVAFNNRAAAHAQLGDMKAAIGDFSAAIKLDPTDALAYRNRGLAQHELNNFAEAATDYDRAIELDETDATTFLYRGNVQVDLQEFDAAIADFDRAIAIDSKLGDAWLNRSIACAKLGRIDQATTDIAQAAELGANVENIDIKKIATAVTSHVTTIEQHLKTLGYQVAADGTMTRDGKPSEVITKELGPDGTVTFNDQELLAFSRTPNVNRVLIVLSSDGSIADMVDRWTPETTKMKPVVFSLKIGNRQPKATAGDEGQEVAPLPPEAPE